MKTVIIGLAVLIFNVFFIFWYGLVKKQTENKLNFFERATFAVYVIFSALDAFVTWICIDVLAIAYEWNFILSDHGAAHYSGLLFFKLQVVVAVYFLLLFWESARGRKALLIFANIVQVCVVLYSIIGVILFLR